MADESTKQAPSVVPAPGPAGANGSGGGNGHGPGAPAPAPPPTPGVTEKLGVPASRRILFIALLGVLVIVGGIFGFQRYQYGKVHVSTDDAYITGNLVNIGPKIGGTLVELTVEEGTVVKKGQLIARLDDSSQRAALRQAQAAYRAALSQIPQAKSALAYQRAQTDAAIRRAQAAIQSQRARETGATAQVRLTSGTVKNQVRQAQSQLRAARAQASQAQAQVQTAQAGVEGAQRAVETARRGAQAIRARIQAAQAEVTRTTQDEARYRRLLTQEAVTQQQYDVVAAQVQTAQSNLRAAQEQAAQGEAQVAQAQAGLDQARAQLAAAREASAAVAQQIGVASAGVGLAQAGTGQVPVQQSALESNLGQTSQAEADLAAAQSGREQVNLRQQQIATAEAQAAQAKAALENAKVAENDTYIYAPADGTVVRKGVNVGVALSPGQTIATITQGDSVWVTANFKETQVTNVRPGQPVEIEVDAFPGRVFEGRVESIIEATGATTSLLPPDNATGNFTKVVQRIPIKIALTPAEATADRKYARAEDIALLRQGMSVATTISTAATGANEPKE